MKTRMLALAVLASSPLAAPADPIVLDVTQDSFSVGQDVLIRMSGGPEAGLFFWLMDLAPGPLDYPGVGVLDVAGSGVLQALPLPSVSSGYEFQCGPLDCDFPLLNTPIYMQVVGFDLAGTPYISNPDVLLVEDDGMCELTGCTPGYWKNHPETWGPTGYSPDDDYDTVFGVDVYEPDQTLLEALSPPSTVHQLEFHSVAALLNASHPDQTYPFAAHVVIELVQDAWAVGDDDYSEELKDTFDVFNNENCIF